MPQTSREAFSALVENGRLEAALGERLKRMVGFCNVAIHNYRDLDLNVVQSIIQHHLDDFERFVNAAVQTNGFQMEIQTKAAVFI